MLVLHTYECGCVVSREVDAGDVITEQIVVRCNDHEQH